MSLTRGGATVADHDQEITEAETAVAKLCADGDGLRAQYLKATADAFRSWAPAAAKARITTNAAQLESEAERIAQVKRAVEALVERADELVDTHLSADSLWPHSSEVGMKSLLSNHRNTSRDWGGPRSEAGGFRAKRGHLQGEVAAILIESEVEKEYPWTAPWNTKNGVLVWNWKEALANDGMNEAAAKYDEVCYQIGVQLRRRSDAITAKSKAAAADMWDQA
jgi:hypothetical protein